MNVILLAAGYGKRLYPITKDIPKALVQLDGIPVLYYQIKKLIFFGATEIVVNVGYLGDQIIEFIRNSKFDIPILISDERNNILNTGGGIKKAAKLFTNKDLPILVHNVDILSNINLKHVYKQNIDNDATLFVSNRSSNRHLLFDHFMNLRGWENTKDGIILNYSNIKRELLKQFSFNGIHILSRKVVNYMDSYPDKFSIIDFYLKHCMILNIKGYVTPNNNILDIGTIDNLKKANLNLSYYSVI